MPETTHDNKQWLRAHAMELTYYSKWGTLASQHNDLRRVGRPLYSLFSALKMGMPCVALGRIIWVTTCKPPSTVPGILTSAWQVEDKYSQLLPLPHQHCNKSAVRFRSFVILFLCQLIWASDHLLQFFFLSKKYTKKWLS